MKLKVIAQYADGRPCDLTLTKEREVVANGKTFEVGEARAKEILAVTFEGKPVAEVVEEPKKEVKKPTKATDKK